ncbi:H4MPT-linked C1 transfer pathway protein [Burkholderia sp. SRS-W-2-2016]|uniref:hydantoinase/oxoprolinase family protein n=1 Tax=Burkholderia sp. SRS-W-2-2016 TaxID=1926878 RepID=UPI00094B3123|nr:hydantoinase/oxoprolinase family protein [Burkholderia sp. SRS-W-2-2016]OLL31490.1 H4MPT-linked C1 transfer pathway protein [Burkholderia sp. SRS-W-2-2016]
MSSAQSSSTNAPALFGWDVGGAHVKVSLADAHGVVRDVAQWACPLWQGLDHLERTIDLVFERWPQANTADARHAVTMTGEMVDLFADRAEGVRAIVATLARRLGARPDSGSDASLRFYAGDAGWLAADACADGWRHVASANWLATANWVATRVADAVLIDIGSTTTDIIPIVAGQVAARASTDAGRLATGELVYHGVVRTPLCGVAHRIEFDGATVNVMNEWFATTADVYRLTGELEPLHDVYPSADQGPKTAAGSRARIARMIGRDAHEASDADWLHFAQRWREMQLREIGVNLAKVVDAHPALATAPLVGAGCGRFLVAALARDDARGYLDFGALAGVPEACAGWAATCAPSVAVALLAAREASSAWLTRGGLDAGALTRAA